MSSQPENDHCPLFERVFAQIPPEGRATLPVEGEIPAYLRGSYYLNGPCRFVVGDVRYQHWLDGDGMVTRLAFRDGQVTATHRFVRSTKWQEEAAAGRALFRTFGTRFAGDRLKRGLGLESPVNVSAYVWGERLLAFGEQGLPWELDAESLETRGEFTFGGKLNAVSPLSAHPHFDPTTGEMFNFGISFSPKQPSLTVYRFAENLELLYRKRLPIDWPASVHDFMLGKNHVLFYLAPHLLEVEGVIQGGKTLMEALVWRPELGSQLLLLDRATGELRLKLALPGRYCLHLINSFEEEGHLFLDVVELERPVYDQYQVVPDLFRDAPAGRPRRYVVDLATGQWREDHPEAGEIHYDASPDFPALDPRYLQQRYQDFWLLGIRDAALPGRKIFDQLAHLQWSRREAPQIWQAPPFHYLGGEPVFLGDPADPSRGCVICQIFDAEQGQSAFLLFDAFAVDRGPIARLPLSHPLPPCFHASWHPTPG